MMLRLVPVIELGYADEGVETPERGPYWEYPADWDNFNNESYKRAGFKDAFTPFDAGSSLYEIEKISDDNLKKIVLDHTEELRNGEYDRDQASPLFGGYILEIYSEGRFYPQCCGNLGDIQFWRNISNGKDSFYEGHPAPIVKFENDDIVFDLSVREFDEAFTPLPDKRTFRFKKEDLKEAINACELILERFAQRIQKINKCKNLNLERIEDLLVWENINYQ